MLGPALSSQLGMWLTRARLRGPRSPYSVRLTETGCATPLGGTLVRPDMP